MTQKIIIYGPTCSGKTGLADVLASRLDAIIINSDSMQLYSEIPIISAQPSNYSGNHKLFAFLNGDQNYSSAQWQEQAEGVIGALEKAGRNIIIVGGTGLYLKALLSGFKQLPSNSAAQREQIDTLIKERGIKYLYDAIISKDPDYANFTTAHDIQRVRRAYGLLFLHNIRHREYQALPNISKYKAEDFLKIYIRPERKKLYLDINNRVNEMLKIGAREEVEAFLQHKYLDSGNVYKAIGIREIAGVLEGRMSAVEATELMKKNTRNYAKRQITFFNHQIKSDVILSNYNDFLISHLN
jgi:tRNA dimethylallyltransferase